MSRLHVAVAAILNAHNEVLLALRPDGVHQGGLWEFPGGKLEPGETVVEALKRELREELGIEADAMNPLIQVQHDYADRSVLLDVWEIHSYRGEAHGMEAQPIRWQPIDQLQCSMFPAANRPIIWALQLPHQYMITGNFDGLDDFQSKLERALGEVPKLVQLRAKHISDNRQYAQLVQRAYDICEARGAKLLLNAPVASIGELPTHGLHLSSRALFEHRQRPVDEDVLLSVSCHDERELQQARRLQADMVLLSPVKPTRSHPGVAGIGWEAFQQLARGLSCPVYALGGMQMSDMDDARQHGAQGIAAISAFWSNE